MEEKLALWITISWYKDFSDTSLMRIMYPMTIFYWNIQILESSWLSLSMLYMIMVMIISSWYFEFWKWVYTALTNEEREEFEDMYKIWDYKTN